MSTLPPTNPNSIDPLLQARLDRLHNKGPAAGRPATGAAAAGRPAGAAPRKGKPAKASKAAALALSTITTLGLAAAFANNSTSSADSVILTSGTAAAGTAAAGTATTAAAGGSTTVAAAPTAAAASGTIVDGTYVGAASSNRFGTVQVQVVYSGGAITDVQILSYPDGDNKSVSINQRSLPTLISEALTAQNAQVDTVSGATYTSNSYKESLQSAIDAAKTASGVA